MDLSTKNTLTVKELENEYLNRQKVFDLFHRTREERDIRQGVLADMKGSPNPDKQDIKDYENIIKKLDKELKHQEHFITHVLKSDIKGEYPFRKNEGGRPSGQNKSTQKRKEKLRKEYFQLRDQGKTEKEAVVNLSKKFRWKKSTIETYLKK